MGFLKDFNQNFSCAIEEINNGDYSKRYNKYDFNNINLEEFKILQNISLEEDFLKAMDKLKAEDIVEFNLKMSQFKQSSPQSQPQSDNTPKCPTCGSTNIKKISGTKRWVSTGIFGLASSNIGKTMQCENCGCKW